MIPLVSRAELDAQTFHDADLRREIIAMFMDQAPVLLQALSAGTGAARSDTAHRLKGSSLAVGAHPLAEAADALEKDPADPAALEAVRLLLTETIQALAAMANG
jgi:HPt (histidine-containing phosphotransfer) domain-containing protein